MSLGGAACTESAKWFTSATATAGRTLTVLE